MRSVVNGRGFLEAEAKKQNGESESILFSNFRISDVDDSYLSGRTGVLMLLSPLWTLGHAKPTLSYRYNWIDEEVYTKGAQKHDHIPDAEKQNREFSTEFTIDSGSEESNRIPQLPSSDYISV